jgi:uncharacterized protein (DUF362 family)
MYNNQGSIKFIRIQLPGGSMPKISHRNRRMSRRDFLKVGLGGSSALLASSACSPTCYCPTPTPSPTSGSAKALVSVVAITDDNIRSAVEEAIDLLGGIDRVLGDAKNVMLKPNLVSNDSRCTTNPQVVGWLAHLMQGEGPKPSGRTVSIGEGSAAAGGYNVTGQGACVTYDNNMLNGMQDYVFEQLGYKALSEAMSLPLVNLHTGTMVDVDVPGGLVYDQVTIHHSLVETDMLVSVPMMKTHYMASVSLGMKNLIGLYPGSKYGTIRSRVHEDAFAAGSEGIAYETLDMVRANKLGLVVIDASTAMEGNGPSNGDLVPMHMIIAGTNPLATDMIGAYLMGYCPDEIPTFVCARKTGMQPQSLNDIVVRGMDITKARRLFKRPQMHTWPDERDDYSPCP